jgi:hypothetical protein
MNTQDNYLLAEQVLLFFVKRADFLMEDREGQLPMLHAYDEDEDQRHTDLGDMSDEDFTNALKAGYELSAKCCQQFMWTVHAVLIMQQYFDLFPGFGPRTADELVRLAAALEKAGSTGHSLVVTVKAA